MSFLTALGVVAAATSLSGVSPGDVSLVPCPVHALTGAPCPGCGMTRACVSLARGDFAAAWDFHPASPVLVLLAIAFAVAPQRTRSAWGSLPSLARRALPGAVLAALSSWWIARLA